MGRPKGKGKTRKSKKWSTKKHSSIKKNTKSEISDQQVEIACDSDGVEPPAATQTKDKDGDRELQLALRVSSISKDEVINEIRAQIGNNLDGFTYESEEEQACPICHDKLMWYLVHDEVEIRVCRGVSCDYPFRLDNPEPYEIRSTNHGKTKQGNQSPLPVTSNVNANTSMSLVKYTGGGASNDQHQEELAMHLIEEYRNRNGMVDTFESFLPEQFIDVDEINYLKSAVEMMDKK